jgi:SseB protein N-terminal domain
MLEGGPSPFRDDDGSADPRVAAALAAFGSGRGSEHAALSALASGRLLVPILAAPSEPEESEQESAQHHPGARPGRASDGDRGSEMSLPTLIGRDGRPAIPVFTCVDAVTRWDARARPVPALASQVWRAAADGSCAVIVDVAGPVPIAVDGARLAALADGRPVPLPHQDPDVLAVVRAAAAGQPAIAGLRMTGGGPDLAADGSAGDPPAGDPPAQNSAGDLQIELTLAAGGAVAAGEEAARLLGRTLMEQLGGRLRRGVTIAVTRPAGSAGGHPAGHSGS